MKQFQTVIGIDVAKETIVVSIFDANMHHVKILDYTKRIIGKELITPFKKMKESIIFVMENTGIYNANLAYWLTMAGFKVSVVNPLIIKRYTQMHLKRIKTESTDAKSIAEYGYEYQYKLSFYKIKDKAQIAVDNLIKVIDDLQQQKTMTNNQYHAIQKQPNPSSEVLHLYKRHLGFINEEIKN